MTPYFENPLITLFCDRAENILPNLLSESFGCVILDAPTSMRTPDECEYLLATKRIMRVVRRSGTVYILTNPEHGVFVVIKSIDGSISKPIYSPMQTCKPLPQHGHPHARPMSAIKGLLMSTTGKILDPFCGIGTTLVMAQALKREAVGVEIDAKFCKTAANLLAV